MRTPTIFLVLFATIMLAGCGTTRFMANTKASAQSAPPAGQVLINIIRPSGFAGSEDMPIFDATAKKMIGNLRGEERMQYICPPGKRLFIGWGEHKSGVDATELKADKIYDLICDSGFGWWRASVSLRPIPQPDERRSKLPEWEKETSLMLPANNSDAAEWAAKKLADVEKVAQEWATDPTSRVMQLKPEDHR